MADVPLFGFTYYECPDCEYDLILQTDGIHKLCYCPLCASDSGHSVSMTSRVATLTDKVEGRDDRKNDEDIEKLMKEA